ncbi:hypothetical protein GCM10027290_40360 [Micromonospora sonneratiae]|uniref:Exo-alpha-sialidase n=1 Tax=Micromonospora sonneratiae TaxID=1184706 RepID=A0ABW3YE05_9ACTN
MRGWTARVAVAGVLTTVVSGCTAGPIRRPAPTAPAGGGVVESAGSGHPDEVRQFQVSVPAGHVQRQIEFTDAEHGYALFSDCAPEGDRTTGPGCGVVLLATADGGRSWQELRHPRPTAQNHQLYAEGSDLVLLAEPHGWYASSDRGRTFKPVPGAPRVPVAYRKLYGRFQVCCDDSAPKVGEWVGDVFRPVPVQPALPSLHMVKEVSGIPGPAVGRSLVAIGLRDGQPYVASSPDEGRTWRSMAVPAPDEPLSRLGLEVAPDGGAWLFGHADDPMRFPQLWNLDGRGIWQRVWAPGPDRITGLVPISGTMLAVIGPGGSGVISEGRYQDRGWPRDGGYLQMLPDGVLFSAYHPDNSVWLGPGQGDERRWIKIVLDPV